MSDFFTNLDRHLRAQVDQDPIGFRLTCDICGVSAIDGQTADQVFDIADKTGWAQRGEEYVCADCIPPGRLIEIFNTETK